MAKHDHGGQYTSARRQLTEPPPSAQVLTLLARSDVAALVARIQALTAAQCIAVAQAFAVNHRLHGREQIRICHRVSLTDQENASHHAEVRVHVWRIARAAAAASSDPYGVAVAAADMAFVLLAGSLLDTRERVLFATPWNAVTRELIQEPAVAVAA